MKLNSILLASTLAAAACEDSGVLHQFPDQQENPDLPTAAERPSVHLGEIDCLNEKVPSVEMMLNRIRHEADRIILMERFTHELTTPEEEAQLGAELQEVLEDFYTPDLAPLTEPVESETRILEHDPRAVDTYFYKPIPNLYPGTDAKDTPVAFRALLETEDGLELGVVTQESSEAEGKQEFFAAGWMMGEQWFSHFGGEPYTFVPYYHDLTGLSFTQNQEGIQRNLVVNPVPTFNYDHPKIELFQIDAYGTIFGEEGNFHIVSGDDRVNNICASTGQAFLQEIDHSIAAAAQE